MAHVATITIDHTKVPGDLTDYVGLIVPDGSAGYSALYALCLEGGGDIRLFKSDDTTELAREIVTFSVSAETGEIHYKYSGTLSSSVDTDIHVYADGSSSDYAVGATYGRNAVWADYEFVNHYETSTTNIPNSTGGANGTASGSITTGTTQKIGQGINNTSGLITAAYTTPSNTSRQLSKTIWFKTTETSAGSFVLSGTSDGGPDNMIYFFQQKLGFRCMAGTAVSVGSINQYRDGNWHKVTLIKTGASTAEGRVDGAFVTSVNVGSDDRADAMWTGGRPSGNSVVGQFDEFRYRESSVSSSYDEAEYNNQNSYSTFYSVAAVGGGSTPAQAARRGAVMMM